MRYPILMGAVGLPLAAAASGATPLRAPDRDEAVVRDVMARHVRALNGGDLESLLALYADDACSSARTASP